MLNINRAHERGRKLVQVESGFTLINSRAVSFVGDGRVTRCNQTALLNVHVSRLLLNGKW